MRCRRTLALLLAAGMLCSGCSTGAISSNYRAVEDLELIQTIGVDRAPEGVWQSVPVHVTVSADVGRTFDLRDSIDSSGGGT